jgi:hypothetical protein
MSDENKDELVVQAGFVTVLTQVGAGRAYVDVPQGEVLPADVSDEDRNRFVASGAVGPRSGDKAYIPQARPVPGEVEPDEIDTDVIPGGSVEQVMAWVGDDLARARVARHEEEAKGDKARANLLAALAEKMASVETEPPAVSESYDENLVVSPAPAGGVAVPSEDPGAGEGKPADEVDGPTGSRRTRNRR